MHSCPQCGDAVTKEQKFCSNCAWKVDSIIFDQEGIICTGQNDDGTACGRQLSNNAKFCPDCATPVQKADADVPVSDANLSAIDNSLTLQNGQNTIGSTDLKVEQHNNGLVHSAEQVGEGKNAPKQKVPENRVIKNSDVANGNSKEISSSTDSTLSDTEASVKLAANQQTPEPNAESQKENPISTQEIPEQASKYVSEDPTPESKLLSKGQTQDNPTSKKQMSDPESKPLSSEQAGVKRDGHKMEVSLSGSKNKTCHTQSSTDEPLLESPPKKQKVSDESTSIQPKLTSENKNVTVTTQPHSVFGSTMSQEKTTASETSTEVQAGPSSERFQDSFIFGKASNVTNPSYCKGEDISDKHDNKKSKEIEDGQNGKNGAGGESSLASEKDRGKQDKETSEDDSSESSDSDSGKSGEGNKDLPLEQKKKKKNRKKTKKIKEEKKKERKKRKENKDGNQNTSTDKNLSTETKKGKNSKNTSTVDTNNSPAGDNTSGSQRQQTSSKKTFAETVTGTSTNTSKKQETVKKQTTGSFVDVCFHVIITPTILINPDKDFVVIAFGNYGGGWDSKKHKLKFERTPCNVIM